MTETTAAPATDARRFTPAEIAEAVAKRIARVGDFDENLESTFAQHGIELDDDGFTLTRGGRDFFVAVVDLDAATGIEKLAEDELKISDFSVRATVDGDTPSVEIGAVQMWSRGLVYLSPADARATALAMLEMADAAEKAAAEGVEPTCTCEYPYDVPGVGHHPSCDLETGAR